MHYVELKDVVGPVCVNVSVCMWEEWGKKYFDRNLVNISRELMETTILIYDCPFLQLRQLHI